MSQGELFHSDGSDRKTFKPSPSERSTNPYGNLVKVFVDTAVEKNGYPPPRQIVQKMANELKKMIGQGVAPDVLRSATEAMAERGNTPSVLPDVVFEMQASMGPEGQDRAAIRLFLERHDDRWPTGARFIRGTHSGNFVWDPLGYDRVPAGYDVGGAGIHRPSRQEVLDALKGK